MYQEFEYWEANKGKWIDTANNADGREDAEVPISSFGFICEWQ